MRIPDQFDLKHQFPRNTSTVPMVFERHLLGQFRSAGAAVSRLAVLVAACSAAVGCSGSANNQDRLPISGTVTLDGVPLKTGYVVFEPKSGQPTQSGGMIKDGKFEVPAADGAAPGTYSVAIFAGDESTQSNKYEPGTPEFEAAAMKISSKQLVPPRYNVNSELKEEVKADGENHFSFTLTSGKR
jgi:hypothetical protein